MSSFLVGRKKKIAKVQRARAGHARDTTDPREAARPRTAGSAPDGPWKDTPCRKRDRYLSVARTAPCCIGCGMLGAPANRPDGTATLLAIGKRGAGSGQRSVEQQVATGARGFTRGTRRDGRAGRGANVHLCRRTGRAHRRRTYCACMASRYPSVARATRLSLRGRSAGCARLGPDGTASMLVYSTC